MDNEQNDKTATKIYRHVGDAVKEEAREWALWAKVGAVIGGVGLGGVGAYYFGWIGFGIGLAAGSIIGAILLWCMWVSA